MSVGATGIDRLAIDFRERYDPYPPQQRFHSSASPYRFLGGAAGPGKTACGIVDHMIACQEFNMDDAPHVHTLMLRRTHPKLEQTLLTRFYELIPKELYTSFRKSPVPLVTWRNGSSTTFGSMQHEENAWDWQGQWLKIFYDELCEFTFTQWNATSAWNRCPVSKYCTKDGAGNPIGVGAPWVRSLWVDHRPCEEMDENQKKIYRAMDYAYFPCTYLDNPIYAKNPQFIAALNSYPEAIRNALMNGSWDIVGGYFLGAFDGAENICPAGECQPETWNRRWISGDWGFEHWSAIYWHYMDDFGVLRTYKERLVKHHDPEMLAEMIVKESANEDGSMPKFASFPFSHDAFADQTTQTRGANPNSIAKRMGSILREAGLPYPSNAGKDKLGREQWMYNSLRKRINCGKTPDGIAVRRPKWIISEECPKLIQCISSAPRDPDRVEQIATFLGDDPLQGAGYGVQWICGSPGKKPYDVLLAEQIAATPDPIERHFMRLRETERRNKANAPLNFWE